MSPSAIWSKDCWESEQYWWWPPLCFCILQFIPPINCHLLHGYDTHQAPPWWPQWPAPCQFLQQSRSCCWVHMESSHPDWVSMYHTRNHYLDLCMRRYNLDFNFIHPYLNCCQTETTSSMILCWVGETFGPFEPRIVWLIASLTCRLWVDERSEKKKMSVNIWRIFMMFNFKEN